MVKKMVTVFGGSIALERDYNISYKVGYLLAEKGWVVVNGAGDCGIMLGVSKGAHDAGGLVVGIVPENDITKINEYIDIPITTGIGYTRNFICSNCTPAGIAIGGHSGTLNEVTNSWMEKKPVVLVNNWTKNQLDYRLDRPTDLLYPIQIEDSWKDCEKVIKLFDKIYHNRKNLGKGKYSNE